MSQPKLVRQLETLPDAAIGPAALCLVSYIDGKSWVGRVSRAGRTTIGRSEGVDLFLDHPSVSREHAAIFVQGRSDAQHRCEIEDLGSRNGTSVGGTRIKPGVRIGIGPGESVMLGSVPMVLSVDRRSTTGKPAQRGAFYLGGAAMQAMLATARRVALGPISVLILGETGAGKEALVEHIHAASPRAQCRLVRLNCAALPEALLESELFGHERGAFTGATGAKMGILEAAGHGTVFLDEVGELALSLQAKLLRAIDERQVLRLGALTPRPINARFVAATNRDLGKEIEAGRFRQDLYYRIAGVTLRVPPLRERLDEIPELSRLFAERSARALGLGRPELSRCATDKLLSHKWPGNVRELKNVVERAVLLAPSTRLVAAHITFDDLASGGASPKVAPFSDESAPPSSAPVGQLRSQLASIERDQISEALKAHAGNQTRAARALGIPRATFLKRLAAYGLARPRKK